MRTLEAAFSSNITRLCIPLTIVLLLLASTGPLRAEAAALTDQPVTDAVEDELLSDPAVPSSIIDVVTHDGVVTLTGVVDNLLAKVRAARIAETVKGVRSVINRIDVVPATRRSDSEIREAVEDALFADPATEAYEIEVRVVDNEVTLSGTVNSWQERELAEKAAMGIRGATKVTNSIVVEQTQDRPDEEIAMDIERRLRWDVLVDHALIDVLVEDGEVSLVGVVGSAAEKTRAVRDAKVAGVKSVDASKLEVEYWTREEKLRRGKYIIEDEEAVKKAVEDALLYDARVDALDVDVEIAGRTAILRGVVETLRAKRAAAQDARLTVGVRTVRNRLKVRPGEEMSDERIAKRLRETIRENPYLEHFEINVRVINGIAHLRGEVDSYFEKAEADNVASSVQGIVAVNNKLSVRTEYDPFQYRPYADDWPLQDLEWKASYPAYQGYSDAEIEKDVQKRLEMSPYVDAGEVEVSVAQGAATLTGTVDSWMERSRAEAEAYKAGAAWVSNRLEVD